MKFNSNELEVSSIVLKRFNPIKNRAEYKVVWEDTSITWGPRKSLVHYEGTEKVINEHLDQFEKENNESVSYHESDSANPEDSDNEKVDNEKEPSQEEYSNTQVSQQRDEHKLESNPYKKSGYLCSSCNAYFISHPSLRYYSVCNGCHHLIAAHGKSEYIGKKHLKIKRIHACPIFNGVPFQCESIKECPVF